MRVIFKYSYFNKYMKRKFFRSLNCLYKNVKKYLADEFCRWVSICLCVVGLFITLVLWLWIRDPCQQRKITESLCQQYHDGVIVGTWCYDICIDQSIRLSHCLSQEQDVTTFFWNNAVIKVASYLGEDNSISGVGLFGATILQEGLTVADFKLLIRYYLDKKLGQVNHTHLIDQLIEFADINNDDKLSLGEATSIWQLLQEHEFFFLFVFQGSFAFPVLNGTCGALYAYEDVGVHGLYNRHSSIVSKVFANSYRWRFPHWAKRANIGIGLLEYSAAIFEEANTRFYMCDFGPMYFGYTDKYEVKVIDVKNIVSESMLELSMKSRSCFTDADCMFGNSCMTVCDKQTSECSNEMKQPFLVGVCEMLKEYLLYDAPRGIRAELGLIISKCLHLRTKQQGYGHYNVDVVSHHIIKHNLILNELKLLLWNEIKDVVLL